MRVLGQALERRRPRPARCPRASIRTSANVVTQKALALAEAGLRVTLGQSQTDAVRDLLLDFWGGEPLDPGFDQLLTTTDAGRKLAQAIGAFLIRPDALAFEQELGLVAAAGPDFMTFAVAGESPGGIRLADAAGRMFPVVTPDTQKPSPASSAMKLGTSTIGALTAPTAFPYTLRPGTGGEGSVTFLRPDNIPRRGTWTCAGITPRS